MVDACRVKQKGQGCQLACNYPVGTHCICRPTKLSKLQSIFWLFAATYTHVAILDSLFYFLFFFLQRLTHTPGMLAYWVYTPPGKKNCADRLLIALKLLRLRPCGSHPHASQGFKK